MRPIVWFTKAFKTVVQLVNCSKVFTNYLNILNFELEMNPNNISQSSLQSLRRPKSWWQIRQKLEPITNLMQQQKLLLKIEATRKYIKKQFYEAAMPIIWFTKGLQTVPKYLYTAKINKNLSEQSTKLQNLKLLP